MKKILLLVLAVLLGLCGLASAQISSPAFDPNCYQPQIGVQGEIDTIYGSKTDQSLGASQIGIGPGPKGGYNRVLFMGYPNNPNLNKPTGYDMVTGGPFLDIHDLNKPKVGFFPEGGGHFGHFHDTRHTDLLYYIGESATIYWADSNGLYDSTHYTALDWSTPDPANNWGWPESDIQPYIARLSNDTVDDIAMIFFAAWRGVPSVDDSDWLVLFKGGEHLYSQGDTARNDEATPLAPLGHFPAPLIPDVVADFRGTGRKDCLSHDDSGNTFLYRNDSVFTTERFVRTMPYDTLATFPPYGTPRAVHFFAKSKGDSSVDLWMSIPRPGDPPGDHASSNFFKGGPSFGSKRLTLADTDFCLRSPAYYDAGWTGMGWGGGFDECGDMTGTGNSVLLFPGGDPQTSYNFYYVMGQAADGKVDMYYSQYYGWPQRVDTITADGDRYQDIIRGNSFYRTQGGGKTSVGTIQVVHGSSKIPVTPNDRFSVTRSSLERGDSVSVAVVADRATLRLSVFLNRAQSLRVKILNILGQSVREGREYAHGTREVFEVPISDLSSGVYAVEVSGESDPGYPAFSQTSLFSIVR